MSNHPLDKHAKEMGFVDAREMFSLISSIDLNTNMEAFEKWRSEDGSKNGLINLKYKL